MDLKIGKQTDLPFDVISMEIFAFCAFPYKNESSLIRV